MMNSPTTKLFAFDCEGTTCVVRPQGSVSSLAAGLVQPEVDELLGQIESREIKNTVFDLADVDYFGSLMLAAMHLVWKRMRAVGGKLVLCNVSKLGHDILHVARFDTLWPVYPTLAAALAAAADGEAAPI